MRPPLRKPAKRDRTLSASTLDLLELLAPHLLRALCCAAVFSAGCRDAVNRGGSISLHTPGQLIRQELSSGKSQSYHISLTAGQYARALFDLSNLEARVALYGPGAQTLAETNSRQNGPTPLSILAEASGTYRLEVRSLEKDSATGCYEAQVVEIRAATPEDRHRVLAEKAYAAGDQLYAESRMGAYQKAIGKYVEARSSWKAAGDRQEEASTLRQVGKVYHLLGEPQQALEYYRQARLLRQELNDRRGEGEILNDMGRVYHTLGENQEALKYSSQALEISKTSGARRAIAQTLNDVGEIYYGLGKYKQSFDYYQQSLSLWRELANRRGQARTLLNLGYTYSDLGEPQKAFDYYNQALPLWQAVNDRRGQTLTLTAIGRLYSRLGESQTALGFFNQALPLAEALGDHIEQARIHSGKAYVYENLGDERRMIDYYNQALRLFSAVNYRNGQAESHHGIGKAYYLLGENRNALDHFRKFLSLAQALDNQRLKLFALRDLGMLYDAEGNKTEALKYYNQTLLFCRSNNDRRGEAFTLNLIGHIYQSQGKKQRALECYNQALPVSQAAEYRFGEALTRYNLARLERDRNRLAEARSHLEASLRIVETLRAKVASQDMRASYLSSVHQHYGLYIDLLMQSHKRHPLEGLDATALQANEQARARSLIEMLTEANANIRQWGDPALIERARKLQQQINTKAERKARLLNAPTSQDEVEVITKEIDAMIAERDQTEAQIRDKNPRYAALTQPRPLNLKEIQLLLDDDTILLEYALGSERSYLWAVTKAELKSYALPGRAVIEKAARPVHDLLISRHPSPGQTERQRDERYWRQSSELSRIILKPVAGQLGAKRLLIVADGILQHIPFGALPAPETPRQRGKGNPQPATRNPQSPAPMIVEHEIVNLPSASTLAVLRRETEMRQPAQRSVAVLADPVFDANDLRALEAKGLIKGAAQRQVASSRSLQTVSGQGATRGGVDFPRLYSTQREAAAIRRAAPADGLFALGFDANRGRVVGDELRQYRIVHFATHGILDDKNPELSAIVLSLVDRQGNPQDGFLRLHDVYNLNLPAELVVLSACDSALGKEIKGEGLVGLTRGFMYAGAARVMASLWQVDDEATAALMEQFYRRMLNDRMPPAAALRQAQIAVWRQRRWRAPYYWAAFVMQGEWK